MKIKIFGVLTIILALALTACDNDKDNNGGDTPCTCEPGTKQEPGEPCCEDPNCPCPIAEPDIKTFSVSFDFQNPVDSTVLYNATIKDERIACGKQNLEQLGIKTVIEQAIQGAFNQYGTTDLRKGRFRNVFYLYPDSGGVTIYVENTATFYKAMAPNGKTLYFHIDYLKSVSDADLQIVINAAINAMDPTNPSVPYNADAPAPATITQTTTPNLAFDGKVTIKTSDPYTASDWNAVVAKVVAALNRGYNKDLVNPAWTAANKTAFVSIFADSQNAEVIVSKSASHNVEVKNGEYNKLYLKDSSLDTVDTQPAVETMTNGLSGIDGGYQANATPPQRGAVLA
jgi:hypothetical protein